MGQTRVRVRERRPGHEPRGQVHEAPMESILGALLTAGLPTKHLARGHPAAAAETKLGEPVHIYIYIYIKRQVSVMYWGRMVWGEWCGENVCGIWGEQALGSRV